MDKIIIKGARENNLKNINVTIPKNKLVVITGLSGSGKSSLAFDTIYAEGQRRYVESLSAYARQFLGGSDKPDVDSIEGLSPAISIDQKTTSKNPRSTVGTITEIYDYLRLLYARIGIPYCPIHKIPITSQSVEEITNKVLTYQDGTKIIIYAPVVRGEKGTHKALLDNLRREGFIKVRLNNELYDLSEEVDLEKNKKDNIDVVIDRLIIKEGIRSRLYESIELATKLARGKVLVDIIGDQEILFSEHFACPHCNSSLPELEPRMFSFNSPYGACPDCKGLGFKLEIDADLIIPNRDLSINEGAIVTLNIEPTNIYYQRLENCCDTYGIDMFKKIKDLTEEELNIILYGSHDKINYQFTSRNGNVFNHQDYYEGIITNLERRYLETNSEYIRDWIEQYMREKECLTCHGQRLQESILAIVINKKNIHEVTKMNIRHIYSFFDQLKLNREQTEIAKLIIKEIKSRLNFLINVGLEYLTLDRRSSTLSGGEAQRIRLATQIGSGLTGVLYVLDEPSIGLHQRDNERLINTLLEMRDLNNTLIVVEHDHETMLKADYLIDIGPGAGDKGGYVVATGTPSEIINNTQSLTGQYLSGKKNILVPSKRRPGINKYIEIKGASEYNLKNIDVKIPLGKFVCITGVSGSGKSTLINEILYKGAVNKIYRRKEIAGKHRIIKGLENIDKIINITQEPIGRTPRSNPATYTKVFDHIRDLFTNTKEAKVRGYNKGRFSFNVKGGRCEACRGDGVKKIAMHFLPDVYVTCEACHGTRYNKEILEIKYKNKTIHDVLNMRVATALDFFVNIPKIAHQLKTLNDVGLGYIKLGQSAPTLSGGEASRVKLARELQKKPTGKSLFILDEPTTGLHTDDVKRLLAILNKIVDNNDTVIVIEHNLDVIKVSDYIIDLGPEGGDLGGEVIATGTPEKIINNKKSYTGHFLKELL